MSRRLLACALAVATFATVPASVCETCMSSCSSNKVGSTYSEHYGTNTFTYTVTGKTNAKKCGGLGFYCSGDSATVVCEYRQQTTTDANGNVSGPYPNNLMVNPCH